MTNISFKKIALPFETEPNTAYPAAEVADKDVRIHFETKEANWPEGPRTFRTMQFMDCLMYRVGSPNDEGFYLWGFDPRFKNSSIYSKKNFPDLEFYEFYEVFGVDWKNQLLGEGTIAMNQNYKDTSDYRHFVFFMKDGTFECVAKEYIVIES